MKAISLKRLVGFIFVLLLISTTGCKEETQYQYATVTMTNKSDENTNLWVHDETMDDSNILKKGESRTHTIERELEALYWDITVYAGRNSSEITSLTIRVSQLHSIVKVEFNGTSIVRME